MDREKFIQASATTRVYEKNLISNSQMKRLADLNSVSEVLQGLSDTIYQDSISKLTRDEDYEIILKNELERVFHVMTDVSPDKSVVNFLEQKYIFHNLKVLVKEIIQDKDYSDIYVDIGDVDYLKLKKDLKDKDKTSDSFYYKAAKAAIDSYEENKDPQVIDLSLDKSYFSYLLKLAKKMDYKFFIDYTKTRIDFMNIKSLLRAKSQRKSPEFVDSIMIDGGNIDKNEFRRYVNQEITSDSSLFKSSDIYYYVRSAIEAKDIYKTMSQYEKVVDNYLMDLIISTKSLTYGAETVFSYIVAKETEIKNLRIILTSKLNGLPLDFIEERLRESYV
ncbi:MAG: V-type ATP synthase subunit C [Tissierellia bacterium]|nr:V-type ATP synthase subunit C [Tissierellia bacterium]